MLSLEVRVETVVWLGWMLWRSVGRDSNSKASLKVGCLSFGLLYLHCNAPTGRITWSTGRGSGEATVFLNSA